MKFLIFGIAVLLISTVLGGCTEVNQNSEFSERDVTFNIEEVMVTSELEIYDFWRDENKIEISADSKFVIISITIENREDKWLAVQSISNSLIDDEGDRYSAEMYIEINDLVYTVQQLTFIDEWESFGLGVYVPSNSIELKKIVFSIPIEREPNKLTLKYGLASSEYDNMINWFETELAIPS